MNTDQLACFISLSSTLNYVKTADQLGLSQPAVSKQIQSLERELGAMLFHRTTRSVSLTQIGQQFLPEATAMLNTYYHSKDWIAGFQTYSRRALRIGYSDPHAIDRIRRVLARIRCTSPHLVPELELDQTDANLRRLLGGQLDLIVGMRDARFSDDQIIFRKLYEETFYCVVRKDHPLSLSLHDTKDVSAIARQDDPLPQNPPAAEEIVLMPEAVTSQQFWQHPQVISIPPYLLKNHFSRGRKILPVNDDLDNILCVNVTEAYGMVLAGFGFALVPGHLLLPHPELAFYRWKETPHAPFGIYYRKEGAEKSSSDVKQFLRTAQEIFLPPA